MKFFHLGALIGLSTSGYVSGFTADSRAIHDKIRNKGSLIGDLASDSTDFLPLLSNLWAGTLGDYL